jgi:acyl carrier protein
MTARILERGAVRPAIAEIVADVFQYEGPVSAAMGPDQIPRWDSLQHIALVRTLEQHFAIQLSMDEMMEIRTVGDIEDVLRRHDV